ncbi:hypothetical protein ACIQXM_17980 [Arthrobacter sp. NPDC097144]|uniref:hypothetical protein n=1 Tax=Arthrobacter sp. NPDC097144 TaxID=3363946 RepID=UPI0038286798
MQYLAYREHQRQRVQTNDTMMGLLAGSKLASQTLMLTEGSKLLMSEIFPGVEHIRRFNLTTEKAREVLEDAEELLGVLAVPQVMALQEHLLVGMLEILQGNVPGVGNLVSGAKAANVHEKFESATGSSFTPETLSLFHLIRTARNTHIHSGGKANKALVDAASTAEPPTREVWTLVTKTAFPTYGLGDKVALNLPELIGILAITKRLAEEANSILQQTLPRSTWADIAVADWLETRGLGNKDQQNKQLYGQTRMYYGPLKLTVQDLEAAKARAGIP